MRQAKLYRQQDEEEEEEKEDEPQQQTSNCFVDPFRLALSTQFAAAAVAARSGLCCHRRLVVIPV